MVLTMRQTVSCALFEYCLTADITAFLPLVVASRSVTSRPSLCFVTRSYRKNYEI